MKKKLIQNSLQEIKQLVKLHETHAYRYKRIDELSDYAVLSLGFITATILSLKPDDHNITTISAALSATGTFLGAVKTMSGVKGKYGKSISIASHLRGIYHDTLVVLAKNHLTPEDYNQILTNLMHEINIATDSMPILDATNTLQGDSLLNLQRTNTPESTHTGFHINYDTASSDIPPGSVSLAIANI
jgi:hypothetical protein